MARLYGQRDDNIRDIVLTFDDGPSKTTTGRLLDILEYHGIKAMFFVVGNRLETDEGIKLIKRAHTQGHVIGNHSYSHPNLRNLSPKEIQNELGKTHDLIVECTGSCSYFRPPYGVGGKNIDQMVKELNYTSVLWNVDTEDWKRKRKGAWVEYGMAQIKKREDSVVLMHDIHQSTVGHIEALIKRIKRIKGHRFRLY